MISYGIEMAIILMRYDGKKLPILLYCQTDGHNLIRFRILIEPGTYTLNLPHRRHCHARCPKMDDTLNDIY